MFLVAAMASAAHAEPWQRHTIDDRSRGADGVRLADVNDDGLLDIATGWEEGGVIRVYLNPGANEVAKPWPAVTVGKVNSAEDAVLVDLDEDGNMDVVSSCEGSTRTLYVHWAPGDSDKYLNPEAWQTEAIPATAKQQAWMFAAPADVDGQHGPDVIVASKGGNATIGWLESPQDPRDLEAWKLHKLYDAGWIMSLQLVDVDRDGDRDVLASDRKGSRRGVLWLENPGPANASKPWAEHRIGANGKEVMFLDAHDRADDGSLEVFAAVKPNLVYRFTPPDSSGGMWSEESFAIDAAIGTSKGIAAGDIDLDGSIDLVFSCEHADPPKSGVVWIDGSSEAKEVLDISGERGIKFDRLELIDLDADGDLDVITCEERHNLGVIWYENPTR